MSDESVELAPAEVIRGWIDAWNRGDLDAFAGAFAAEAVVIPDPSWMEPGPFEGRAAIREWHEGLRESWDNPNAVVITELLAVGDRVLARVNWQVRGRSSGIETHLDATTVSRIDRGKIVRQQWYFEYEKAVEAAGSSE